MMSRRILMTFLCVTAAATATVQAQSDNEGWTFTVMPYALLPNIKGDTTVGRVSNLPVDVDTGDILSNLDLGFMLQGEAWKGNWGLSFNYAYMQLDVDRRTAGGVPIGVELEQSILEAYLKHRHAFDGKDYADVYFGARLWAMDIDLSVGEAQGSRNDDWVDPVVGVRGIHYVCEDWFLSGQADIGGFGVSSDFTWNLQAGGGYDFSETISALVEYRYLDVDYDNGDSGKDRFGYSTVTHGVLIGVALNF